MSKLFSRGKNRGKKKVHSKCYKNYTPFFFLSMFTFAYQVCLCIYVHVERLCTEINFRKINMTTMNKSGMIPCKHIIMVTGSCIAEWWEIFCQTCQSNALKILKNTNVYKWLYRVHSMTFGNWWNLSLVFPVCWQCLKYLSICLKWIIALLHLHFKIKNLFLRASATFRHVHTFVIVFLH